MTQDSEVARIIAGLTPGERQECEQSARESGWPDELYFGLVGLRVKAALNQGRG